MSKHSKGKEINDTDKIFNYEYLRDIREARGYTKTELANSIGITLTHVTSIEKGINGLSIQILIKIAELLEVEDYNSFFRNRREDELWPTQP